MTEPEFTPSVSDADFDSMLSFVSQTIRVLPSAQAELLEQLREVSAMLSDLDTPPTEPSLMFRRFDGKLDSKPIGDALTVGRLPANRLAFPERPKMGRRQFTITRWDGRYVLTDPASKNGTFLRGIEGPVRTRELRDGDIIKAGDVTFVFVRPD